MKVSFLIGTLILSTFALVAFGIAMANAQRKAMRAQYHADRASVQAREIDFQRDRALARVRLRSTSTEHPQLEQLEQQSQQIARTIKTTRSSDSERIEELHLELVAILDRAFEMRQKLSVDKAVALEKRIKSIKTAIEQRKQNKQLIISNRASELLGRNGALSWEGPVSESSQSTPSLNRFSTTSTDVFVQDSNDLHAPEMRVAPGLDGSGFRHENWSSRSTNRPRNTAIAPPGFTPNDANQRIQELQNEIMRLRRMENSRSRGKAYPVTPTSPRAPYAPADPASISEPGGVSPVKDDLLTPAAAPRGFDAPAADPADAPIAEPAAVPAEDPEAAAENSDLEPKSIR